MSYEVTGRSCEGLRELAGYSQSAVSQAMTTGEPEPRWYATYTRSRHEKSVAEQLRRKDVETFLPLYHSTHRWKNGDHLLELPLFPGYAFVRIDLKDRLHVLKVPGVVQLVGFGGTPAPLGTEEIEALKRALSSSVKALPHPYLTVGRRVRITSGPLAGREGILMRKKTALRVVLSVDLIQRSILVDVDGVGLEPLRQQEGFVRHESHSL